MDIKDIIIPLISGLFSIFVAMANNKSNVKKEDSNHANILFEQYKERVVMLQSDVIDREKRIRELQDSYDIELQILKEKIDELDEAIAEHKEENLELQYVVKRLRLELEANGINIDADIQQQIDDNNIEDGDK